MKAVVMALPAGAKREMEIQLNPAAVLWVCKPRKDQVGKVRVGIYDPQHQSGDSGAIALNIEWDDIERVLGIETVSVNSRDSTVRPEFNNVEYKVVAAHVVMVRPKNVEAPELYDVRFTDGSKITIDNPEVLLR